MIDPTTQSIRTIIIINSIPIYIFNGDRYTMTELEAKFKYTTTPSILLSIVTIILNIFLINYYRKTELTVVPLLYTLIATMDILCAAGTIYQYIALEIYFSLRVRASTVFDVNAIIFLLIMQISNRCSVFCNLVLAVCRTIMIAKPFYNINIKAVKLACTLYAVPWVTLSGIRIYIYYSSSHHSHCKSYFDYVYLGGYIISAGLCEHSGSNNNIKVVHILLEFLAFLIPVVIVFITCIIQIITLIRSNRFATSSNQRHVTITVLLMSIVFVAFNTPLCVNSVIWLPLIRPSETYMYPHYHDHNLLFATVFALLNGVFNPIIIITRSSGMRRKLLDFLKRVKSWIQNMIRD